MGLPSGLGSQTPYRKWVLEAASAPVSRTTSAGAPGPATGRRQSRACSEPAGVRHR